MNARPSIVDKALAQLSPERRQAALVAANGLFDLQTSTYWNANPAAVARVWAAAIDATGRDEPSAPAPMERKRGRDREPKAQGREVSFPEIEPWPDPVVGVSLLDEIRLAFERFLVLPEGAAVALTLWMVHAHAHDLCEVSPLLVLKSPAMRCGKTTALRLLGRLVPRPLHASNITASAAFRSVEKYRPTLLVDEADSFIGKTRICAGSSTPGTSEKTPW